MRRSQSSFYADAPKVCEDAKCDEEDERCVQLENDELTAAVCVPRSKPYLLLSILDSFCYV